MFPLNWPQKKQSDADQKSFETLKAEKLSDVPPLKGDELEVVDFAVDQENDVGQQMYSDSNDGILPVVPSPASDVTDSHDEDDYGEEEFGKDDYDESVTGEDRDDPDDPHQQLEEHSRDEPAAAEPEVELEQIVAPPAVRRRRTRQLVKPEHAARAAYNPEQRLLLLDTWRRSGLPAKDFAGLIGISKHTLYKWKQMFERFGPEGLMDKPKGPRKGIQLSEVTKRAILMMKEAHPEWGCQRISDMLQRGPALAASPSAVAKLLHLSG